MKLYDIHTHQITRKDSNCLSILDAEPLDFETSKSTYKNQFFSCGIHPWCSEDSEARFQFLSKIASDHRIVAIGETGLDKIKGPSMDVQISLFKRHIELSEELKKPLIIHAVKAWDELYHIRKEFSPTQAWIIHGFRGNPQVTQQMVKTGFMFSIGERFNPESLKYIPKESLFLETDESGIGIKLVYQQVAEALNFDLEDLATQIAQNVHRLFPNL